MKIKNLKEKIDGAISLVDIGDVSFAMLTQEWKEIKKKILNKEHFSFKSISNKEIHIRPKVDGKLQIMDTFKNTLSDIEFSEL